MRGRVIRARDGRPADDVEVLALDRPPSLERFLARVESLMRRGLWTESRTPQRVLGRARTDASGAFEILGLPAGRVFLDARSAALFVRTPRSVRLATGEIREGIELLGQPGGGVHGIVLEPSGEPAADAVVGVRPGLNSTLAQLTQRRVRWLEARTDALGHFEILGVPPGPGYVVSASHPSMALEEVPGIVVRAGEVAEVEVRGRPGAVLAGVVVDPTGQPVAGASIGAVYLNLSSALLSADGRAEPVRTDERGQFRLTRVASGRVALAAEIAGAAPSEVLELAVAPGVTYDGLELRLGVGLALRGEVVDDGGAPVSGARVMLRSVGELLRPRDPDAVKGALSVRNLEVRSAVDGTFALAGLTQGRWLLQAIKTGHATAVHSGVRPGDEPLRIEMPRAATVRGHVVRTDGTPVERLSVQVEARSELGDELRRRLPWGPRAPLVRSTVQWLPAGTEFTELDFQDDFEEIRAPNGDFEIAGVPPGPVRLRVWVPGFAPLDDRDLELAPGETSDLLQLVVQAGATISGTVIDEVSGAPVADAQVTAHRARARGAGPFAWDVELEDFDFLALSTNTGRRSTLTDRDGRFSLTGIGPGDYRVVARHPDLAKSAGEDVPVQLDGPPPSELVLRIGPGGAVEGRVTGASRLPLADAMVVALSMSAGAFKSATTDGGGEYRIEGLVPGRYVVFKSRIDAGGLNVLYEFLGNLRLQAVSVRRGNTTRVDLHDEAEGTVRVVGVVRDAGVPVPRVMVTALSSDRDGVLGMGVRAQPTDQAGRYELRGMKSGQYYFQVSRFLKRPQQANLSVEVPEGIAVHQVDLDLPQSAIRGVVVDSDGAPVAGVRVQAGLQQGGIDGASGLLGIILNNAVTQDRTNASGVFEMRGMAAGVYRVVATGRRARGAARERYGDVQRAGVRLDGIAAVDGLTLVLPRAGRVRGIVVDASGAPVEGAEVHCVGEDGAGASRRRSDLFGLQTRPARTDAAGRFEVSRLTPGSYTVRADAEGLAAGVQEGVWVAEGQAVDLSLAVVRGATLRVRVTSVDGGRLPPARMTILDGSGKPLARKMSVFSVFRRFVRSKPAADTGWIELGQVPPDHYTLIITEDGHADVKLKRVIADGEIVEWELDMAEELERRGR